MKRRSERQFLFFSDGDRGRKTRFWFLDQRRIRRAGPVTQPVDRSTIGDPLKLTGPVSTDATQCLVREESSRMRRPVTYHTTKIHFLDFSFSSIDSISDIAAGGGHFKEKSKSSQFHFCQF